jgi:16S rRNA C967 or C1407 C5-methylase (RsmB/RsmF family)
MCASPGSKTLQALERTALTGKVLANDVLQSRLEALQQAVERSGMPIDYTKRIQYSCCDASQLQTTKQYHVILCDVPCSGDGTCRKDKHILPMWKPNHGNRLHETQVKILVRAMQLLKKGGVVCYSTCSLNPVENEAVVAAALCRMKGAVQLVDFPNLPGFTQRPGVDTWRVAHYTDEGGLVWYDTYQEAVDNRMDDKPLTSMWPPSSVDDTSSENDNLHLERCTRLWPQDHDSGGFFLALLQKTSKS